MKSKGVAYLLHIFFGFLGAGRFYVGDIGMGILNLLTFGGFGFLWFIDLFLLSGRVDYKNALFAASIGGRNTINNVNAVHVNIDSNLLKNMQAEPAATTQENKTDGVDLSKN
ncbi:TM2 domain-containing protein [Bacillus toyonensis]|uniref:TM2 domain-containing protein n=1 Tax=Bacillus toyonensis TaxID=155322 RepID=UPI002700823A|nr:TM2 domain-containing protein [Bacillus toyonensis]MDO8159670.1 TM2 domain-containing protein [Bacillus toyonensis]